MRISDWSSDVCSSDLFKQEDQLLQQKRQGRLRARIRVGHAVAARSRAAGRRRCGHRYSQRLQGRRADRKSVVSGKSVSVRVDIGGRSIIKKNKKVCTSTSTRQRLPHHPSYTHT